ncbi:MAG: Secretion system C-terminal sorting domain, partial [Bacteroidota bacterium]
GTSESVLFPNPAHRRLQWSVSEVAGQSVTLEIYSITGELILRRNQQPATGSIDIADLVSGNYICVVSNASYRSVKRLVVQ